MKLEEDSSLTLQLFLCPNPAHLYMCFVMLWDLKKAGTVMAMTLFKQIIPVVWQNFFVNYIQLYTLHLPLIPSATQKDALPCIWSKMPVTSMPLSAMG